MTKKFFMAMMVLLILPLIANATPITGFLATPPETWGVEATGGWVSSQGGFRIEWIIDFDGTYWNYQYKLTDCSFPPLFPSDAGFGELPPFP